jgi:pimeloyl-ACP methyl ester carboxylesterase
VAGALLWSLAFLVILNGLVYLLQPRMVFFPDDRLMATPADWGLVYEEVWLESEDGVRLHGWYLPHPGSGRVLLFFHGNAGNISHRRASVEIFHRLGLNLLIFDYRGYGLSQGRPSEQGLYRDAATVWRYLTRERGFRERDILIFGRSLGGGSGRAAGVQGDARQADPGVRLQLRTRCRQSCFSLARLGRHSTL